MKREEMSEEPRELTEERLAVEEYGTFKLIPDEDYYLIHRRWWHLWREYLCSGTDRPGAIDNSPLLDTTTAATAAAKDTPEMTDSLKDSEAERAVVLKRGMVEGVDYAVVVKQLWKILRVRYGLCEPEVVVKRTAIAVGVQRKVILELFPVHVVVLTPLSGTAVSEHEMTFSRNQTMKDVRYQISILVKYPPHRINLFISHPSAAAEKRAVTDADLRKTLEELSVSEGDRITMDRVSVPLSGWDGSRRGERLSYTVPPPEQSTAGTPPVEGAVGLSNLGSTCFLNSAMQCLSHTLALSMHFLAGESAARIAREGQHGDPFKKGFLASKYAALLKDLWFGRFVKIVPREFKALLAQFAPQTVASYSQQDAQEFLSEFLNALDNDLTPGSKARVATDPSCTAVGAAFEGRTRSSVICRSCGFASSKVEPFLFLSLPVPWDPVRRMSVVAVPRRSAPKRITVAVPKSGKVADVRAAVSREAGIPGGDRLVLAEVYRGQCYPISDSRALSDVHSTEDVFFAYEVSGPSIVKVTHKVPGKTDKLAIPFYLSLSPLHDSPITTPPDLVAELRRIVALFLGVETNAVPRFDVLISTNNGDEPIESLGMSPIAARGGSGIVIEWSPASLDFLEQHTRPELLGPDPTAQQSQSPSSEMRSTLQDCIGLFSMDEELEGVPWRCPGCLSSAFNAAVKKMQLVSPTPPHLAVHLKRFRAEGVFREKVATCVDFPVGDCDDSLLDLGPHLLSAPGEPVMDALYELYGVICHSGGISSGHYISYVRCADSKWRLFDDSAVSEVENPRETLHSNKVTSTAYVLFYQKCGSESVVSGDDMLSVVRKAAAEQFPLPHQQGQPLDKPAVECRSVTPQPPPPPPPSPAVVYTDAKARNAVDLVDLVLGDVRSGNIRDPTTLLTNAATKLSGGMGAGFGFGGDVEMPFPEEGNNDGPEQCPLCSRRFMDTDTLQVHVMAEHPELL